MRLIVARCEVNYSGRLTARLPEALRLLMVKADGSVLVHADAGGYKPLNWMTPPTVVEADGDPLERLVVRKRAGKTEDRLEITILELLSDVEHEMGEAAALEKDGVERDLQEALAAAPRFCGEGFRLVRREHTPAGLTCRVEADEAEVARQLLDGVDRADALDLDRDPAVLLVAAHEVDGPDVGRPLAADEPEALAAALGGVGQRDLQVRLDPVLLEPGGVEVHLVRDVGEHLEHADLQPVLGLARSLTDDEPGERVAVLLDHGRGRHPVERLVAARVGVHEDGAVGLEDEQPHGLRQVGVQTAGVRDLAAGDDETHGPEP